MGRWSIGNVGGVHVVTMASNAVNAIDDEFLSDLQAALAELQSAEPLPVVLTGAGTCFSAGLHIPTLYEYDRTTLASFVDRFDQTMLAWFSFPRPTIAAVNGHAIAGGCVLALACDLRVAADGDFRIGLNEVQVGIPFPGVAFEIARSALASERIREVMLTGALYSPREALTRGLADEVVEAEELNARAIAIARTLGSDSLEAYATAKAQLSAPAMTRITESRDRIDREFLDVWFSESGRRRLGTVRDRLLRRQ